jgi:hypothetical protein
MVARIDEACDRFEHAWQAGRRPRIEDYLADASGPEHRALLRELLVVELGYRRCQGETPTPIEYQARFPAIDLSKLGLLERAAGQLDDAQEALEQSLLDALAADPDYHSLRGRSDFRLLLMDLAFPLDAFVH